MQLTKYSSIAGLAHANGHQPVRRCVADVVCPSMDIIDHLLPVTSLCSPEDIGPNLPIWTRSRSWSLYVIRSSKTTCLLPRLRRWYFSNTSRAGFLRDALTKTRCLRLCLTPIPLRISPCSPFRFESFPNIDADHPFSRQFPRTRFVQIPFPARSVDVLLQDPTEHGTKTLGLGLTVRSPLLLPLQRAAGRQT